LRLRPLEGPRTRTFYDCLENWILIRYGPSDEALPNFRARASFFDLDTKKGLFLTPAQGSVRSEFALLRPDRVKSILLLMSGLTRGHALSRQGGLVGLTWKKRWRRSAVAWDAKLMFICCMCLMSSMHCNDVLDAPAAFCFAKLKKYHDLMPPGAVFCPLYEERHEELCARISAPIQEAIVLHANIRTSRDRIRGTGAYGRRKERLFDKVIFACNAIRRWHCWRDRRMMRKDCWAPEIHEAGSSSIPITRGSRNRTDEGYTFCISQGQIHRNVRQRLLASLAGVSKKSGLISTQHPISRSRRTTGCSKRSSGPDIRFPVLCDHP